MDSIRPLLLKNTLTTPFDLLGPPHPVVAAYSFLPRVPIRLGSVAALYFVGLLSAKVGAARS
jgi:hypothetical protein